MSYKYDKFNWKIELNKKTWNSGKNIKILIYW
jgi:hypothetical protein